MYDAIYGNICRETLWELAYGPRDQKHSSGNWNTMKQSTALSGVMGRDLTTVLIHGLLFTPGGLRWTRVKHLRKEALVMFVNKALRLKSVVDVNSPACIKTRNNETKRPKRNH